MAVKLTKKELENIKNYRYSTNAATPMDNMFEPFWNGCTALLPNVSHLKL